jgi:hypothetical protein
MNPISSAAFGVICGQNLLIIDLKRSARRPRRSRRILMKQNPDWRRPEHGIAIRMSSGQLNITGSDPKRRPSPTASAAPARFACARFVPGTRLSAGG